MKYLLTHSLLSAWLYSMKDDPFANATTKDTSKEDFMLVLMRKPTPTTESMQNGIDFENLVTDICRYVSGPEKKIPEQVQKNPWFEPAFMIAERVYGGQFQHAATKRVNVDGTDLLLYGRLDALKAGSIYDIKFSTAYERGKYFESTQHKMYLELVPEADRFTYLISNGNDMWTETYRRDETPSIYPVISGFLKWLEATGMMVLYKQYWGAK